MSKMFTKSAKGLREASGKTHTLEPAQRAMLHQCKGQFIAEDLVALQPLAHQEDFARALAALIDAGYLREIVDIREPSGEADFDADDDNEHADQPGDDETPDPREVIRRAEAERLRLEVAARRGLRDEATTEQVRQADDAARRKARERERQEAEEIARREAQENLRREEAALALRLQEEAAARAAEEAARVAAEAAAKARAEEAARLEVEERMLRAAAERARRKAAEAARLAEEEKERELIRQRIAARRAHRRKLTVGAFIAVVATVTALLWLVQTIPFEGKRAQFAARLQEATLQPVTLGSVHFALLPQAQWLLDDMRIGSDARAVHIGHITLRSSLAALWGLPARFDGITLAQVRASPAAALAMLHDTTAALPVDGGVIEFSDLRLGEAGAGAPPLSGEARFAGGHLASIVASGADDDHGEVVVDAQRVGAAWQIGVRCERALVPFGLDLPLHQARLRGELTPDSLAIGEFSARHSDGDIKASGTLSWREGWALALNVEAAKLDASLLAPAWFGDGLIEADGHVEAQAAQAGALWSRARLSGRFALGPGTLLGVDLDRVMQARGIGEMYHFERLTGEAVREGGRASIDPLHLQAGALAADGRADIAPDGAVTGRFALTVNTAGTRLAGSVGLTGTVAKPAYQK